MYACRHVCMQVCRRVYPDRVASGIRASPSALGSRALWTSGLGSAGPVGACLGVSGLRNAGIHEFHTAGFPDLLYMSNQLRPQTLNKASTTQFITARASLNSRMSARATKTRNIWNSAILNSKLIHADRIEPDEKGGPVMTSPDPILSFNTHANPKL